MCVCFHNNVRYQRREILFLVCLKPLYIVPCVKKNWKDSYREPSRTQFYSIWLFTIFWIWKRIMLYLFCTIYHSCRFGSPPKNLVVKPVTDCKHLLGKDGYLTTHATKNTTKHRWGEEFLKRINNPTFQIDYQLNKQHQKEVLHNREKLK